MSHRRIIKLLPLYLNRTLEPQQARSVEDHLETCSSCSRQLEELRHIQASLATLDEEPPTPPEARLQQALAAIEEHERKRGARKGWLEDLQTWFIESLTGWWQPLPTYARAVVTVQFILLLAVGALFLTSGEPGGETFTTVSAPDHPASSTRTTLIVGFQEDATESQMRQAILEIDGLIVSGPSALGLYDVEIPAEPEEAEKTGAALRRLRDNPAVVRLAEQKR